MFIYVSGLSSYSDPTVLRKYPVGFGVRFARTVKQFRKERSPILQPHAATWSKLTRCLFHSAGLSLISLKVTPIVGLMGAPICTWYGIGTRASWGSRPRQHSSLPRDAKFWCSWTVDRSQNGGSHPVSPGGAEFSFAGGMAGLLPTNSKVLACR